MATIWSWHRGNPVTVMTEGDATRLKTSEDFFHAAIIGDVQTVRETLDAENDVNRKNDYNWTALMLAAFNGETDVVKLLVDRGADLETTNEKGETALILAVQTVHTGISPEKKRSQVQTVRLLVRAGANLNATDARGHTALKRAAENGLLKITAILKKAGAK